MEEQEVRERLRQWRAAHPRATFDEIDAEVQRQFAPLQAQVVAELSGRAADGAREPADPAGAQVRCPACGAPMQRRGRRTRQVPTRQGAWVPLHRRYYVCPACGAGHFPPR